MAGTFESAVLNRNHVTVQGEGPTLLFAHGFGCDQRMWRFIEPALRASYRTVLFDYVGCGRSDVSAFDRNRYATLDGYAQDLIEVCEALQLQEATLVAHSVSAMIGVLASAKAAGRIGRLIMIGPSPRYVNDLPHYHGGFERDDIAALLELMDHNYLGWAAALAPAVMGNPERPELTRELQDSFCSTDPVAARTFAHATFYADNRGDVERVTVPTAILQVRDDSIAPLSVGEYLHARIPASKLTVLEASGHCPHVSHPELTLAALLPHLPASA